MLVALIVANLALAQTSQTDCVALDVSTGKIECGSCTKIETVVSGSSPGVYCKTCSNGKTPENTVVVAETKDNKAYINYGAKCSSQVVALAVGLMGLVAALLN